MHRQKKKKREKREKIQYIRPKRVGERERERGCAVFFSRISRVISQYELKILEMENDEAM